MQSAAMRWGYLPLAAARLGVPPPRLGGRAALMIELLVASRNRKKLAELRRVLDAAALTGLTLVSLDDVPPFDEAPETGATFEDNALAKARHGFAATGLPTVADDSGL